MKFLIYAIATLLLLSCSSNYSGEEVLLKSAESLKRNQFYEYSFIEKIKYFDTSDTTAVKDDYLVYRQPEDSILGFYTIVGGKTTRGQKVYDGVRALFISHEEKLIRERSLQEMGVANIKNNFNKVPSFLYSKHPFKNFIEKSESINVSDTIIDSRDYWSVDLEFPSNEDVTYLRRVVFIDKKTFLPYKIIGFAKFQDIQDEYSERTFDYKDYGDYDMHIFYKNLEHIENYGQIAIKQPDTNFDLLPLGTDMIPVSGVDVDKQTYVLNKETSKDELILLDFWYLGCVPCLKAMPFLEQLNQRFQHKGLKVVGVNPYDDVYDDYILKDIKAFMEKHSISYEFAFTDSELAKEYQVFIFPSMYLIKDGKIIYAHNGYSEKSSTQLEKVIDSIIRIKK